MLTEGQQAFTLRFGFPSDAIISQEYLTDERLTTLAAHFGPLLATLLAVVRTALGDASLDSQDEGKA